MSIPPRFLDELRNRLTLSEVIGKRISVKRAGREYKACCPFHKEKTPSFTINDDKQFYHCFGCGAHGSVIDFVMEYDNLHFVDAVETLAAQAGMQVPKQSPQEREKAKKEKDLYSLMEEAAGFFIRQLQDNKDAHQYILDRGLTEETLASFKIGYAPADGQALRKHLSLNGYTDQQMLDVGLLKKSTRGGDPYIFFRERIMFPVADRRGRVVAFGGRIMPDHLRAPDRGDFKPPKYINTAETTLFDKGRMLYGEPLARQATAEGHTLIVVEGYMDVIACHQGGFRGAVAPMGTALTEDQIMLLWKMAGMSGDSEAEKSPVLCFDGDKAGRGAASRAVERLLPLIKAGQSARLAFLPEGQDPDSMIKGQGKAALQNILRGAVSLFDFIWSSHVVGRQFETPEARAGIIKILKNEMFKIADRDVQVHYNSLLQSRISETFFPRRDGGRGNTQKAAQIANSIYKIRKPSFEAEAMMQRVLLAAVLNHPFIFETVEEALASIYFKDAGLCKIYEEMSCALHRVSSLDTKDLQSHLMQSGLEKEMSDICSESVYVHGAFCAPSADPDRVLGKWQGFWRAYQAKSEKKEINQGWKQAYQTADEEYEERLRGLVGGVGGSAEDLY